MAKLGPLPVVDHVLKIRHIYNAAGQNAVNVYHVKFTGTIPDSTVSQPILTQLLALATTNIKPLHCSDTTLNTIELTDLTSRTGIIDTIPGYGGGAGTSTAHLPNNVACVVSFPVPLRFRGGHARMYLPGQSSVAMVDPSHWTGAWVTTVQNAMRAWRNGINGMTGPCAPFQLTMVSYFTHDVNKNPIYNALPIPIYPITGVTVHSRIDSQRRRLGKEI